MFETAFLADFAAKSTYGMVLSRYVKGILNVASTPRFQTTNILLDSKGSESGLTKVMTQTFGSESFAQKFVSSDFEF